MYRIFFKTISFLLLLVYFTFLGCKNELDYDLASSFVGISSDSILFDTIISPKRSQTYKLMIYNKQDIDVEIPKIYLEKGNISLYKLNVNGIAASEVKNIALRKNDSLFVFVEIASDNSQAHESVYEDNIIIQTLAGVQKVNLTSFIENANYHYPSGDDYELEITTDQVWNASKSHVIYKTVRFTNNSKLTVLEGTKIYFHENSNLVFDSGAELIVNGSVAKKVIFRSDQHTFPYELLPDQWNSIEIKKNSSAKIENAIIIGGKTGLRTNEANITLTNVQLYNHSLHGIFSTNSTIVGKNVVINNCGNLALRILQGGDYQFYHSTFANFWKFTASSSTASVYISNRFFIDDIFDNKPLTRCFFGNCIIDGATKKSLYIDENFDQTIPFEYNFDNNLIKNTSNPSEVTLNPFITNSIVNGKSDFTETSYDKNNLRLNTSSDAINKGKLEYTNFMPTNIEGSTRNSPANLGAY